MTKQKIAVIGSGVGATTAIFAITQTPNWQEKYDITVYQMGWRMGGKGASGRNMDHGGRIEEHGLHVWAGFYQNAFRHMATCYDQLVSFGLRDADAPLGTLKTAFKPLSHLFLAEQLGSDDAPDWRPWLIDLPGDGDPDVPYPGNQDEVLTPWGVFTRLMSIMREMLETGDMSVAAALHLGEEAWGDLLGKHRALHDHAHAMPDQAHTHLPRHKTLLSELISDLQNHVLSLETPENIDHDATRRILLLMDAAMAYAQGMASSAAFTAGYDVLDQWEFSDWLRDNGGSELMINSAMVRGCYDFVFGFSAGDIHRGNVGTGTAVRAMGRLILTYTGAIFFRMQAGMGDTIFAPYFQVLRHQGVKFRFFNAARALRLNEDGTAIAAIDMVAQATIKDGGAYDPLVPVQDLPCWPSEPLWDQLVDGAALKASGVNFESEASPPDGQGYTLQRGVDFDHVLLGASIGSLGYLTAELAQQSHRWQRMLDSVQTVGTQAAQFWLTKSADDLGWRDAVLAHNPESAVPPAPMRTMITGFAEPLDTWADMSHLLEREDWPEPGPASIAYFCSPAPDGQTLENFTAQTDAWANDALTSLWPGAKDANGGFDAQLYYPPKDGPDGNFDDQYFRVNMFGSERYVLSVAGSLAHRLAPGDSGFENLTLAGDWTRCGINAGCVEAATMSGIAAASAITGVHLPNVGAEDIPYDGSLVAKAAFQTNSISDAAWPISGFFARGHMTGWFFFYAMPRAEVEAMLPRGVTLGISPLVPKDMHPVGISLSHYTDVRGSFVPGFMRFWPYQEASFAIPHVQTQEGGAAPLLYPRRLYVNNRVAIAAGRWVYAMPKERAVMDMDAHSFHTATMQGRSILKGTFEQQDDMMPLSEHPAFGSIADLLNISFVTTRGHGDLRYNAFNLELERAYVAPVAGHVSVTDPLKDGFPAGDLHLTPLRDVANQPGLPGAFRLWSSWSLTNPLDNRRVLAASKARAYLRRTYR